MLNESMSAIGRIWECCSSTHVGWTWLVGRTHTAWTWFWVMLMMQNLERYWQQQCQASGSFCCPRKVQHNHWPSSTKHQWPAQPPLLINALLTFVSLPPPLSEICFRVTTEEYISYKRKILSFNCWQICFPRKHGSFCFSLLGMK